jgi:rhamnose transport system ATP-binding protein
VPGVLLSADSVSKSFSGVVALRGVSFDIHAGEVHALVGENGAGKSTLIKIMSGAESADEGTLVVRGRVLARLDPSMARGLGIAVVHQQPALFPDLSVAENLSLSVDRDRAWRRVHWQARRARAGQLLARVGASIDPDRLVESLTMPEQQLVEIARAIGANAELLILDEPTASLTAPEVEALLGVVRRLRAQGTGIVYISHRLEEVLSIADRVTVLRDGRTVDTRPAAGVTPRDLVQLMVGDTLLEASPRQPVSSGDAVLEVRGLSSRAARIRDISFSLHRGEILGLAGLAGSGRTQVAETLFGITPMDTGEVRVGGTAVEIDSPRDAMRAGIAYVPEDRRRHGVVLEMPITTNSTLASLTAVSHLGLIDRRAELSTANRYIDRLRIKAESAMVDAGTLSGGNQQKVALARWLATSPVVLILDEPTQGIDVRSKAEIHRLIQELAGDGIAVLVISSDMHDVLTLNDRILVMRDGTIAGELTRERATQHAVLALALGTERVPAEPH